MPTREDAQIRESMDALGHALRALGPARPREVESGCDIGGAEAARNHGRTPVD